MTYTDILINVNHEHVNSTLDTCTCTAQVGIACQLHTCTSTCIHEWLGIMLGGRRTHGHHKKRRTGDFSNTHERVRGGRGQTRLRLVPSLWNALGCLWVISSPWTSPKEGRRERVVDIILYWFHSLILEQDVVRRVVNNKRKTNFGGHWGQ